MTFHDFLKPFRIARKTHSYMFVGWDGTGTPYITFLALINLTFLYWGYWSFETFNCNPELSDSEKPKMKFIARRAMNIEQVFKFVLKYVK